MRKKTDPIANLKPGDKVRGTTIAEFGAGNRVLDMIVYRKDGKEFLLMSNNSRGVMKIPTAGFGTAETITTRVDAETGGVKYETVASMKGIEQLDLLNPFPRPRGFVKKFRSYEAYMEWRSKEENPRLW